MWLIVLALAVGAYFAWQHYEGVLRRSQASRLVAPGAVAVTTAIAKKGSIGVYLESIGTVTPVYTSSITAQVNGLVTAVHYVEGQIVHKGDPLIDIDPRPFQAQVLQAEGTLLRDIGVLAQSKMDLERYRAAWARNAIPKQQLDDQEKLVLQNEGQVRSDQGNLQFFQVQLGWCHITAPFTGRVGLRLVDPGNVVVLSAANQINATTSLVVITQTQPITVVFTIAQDNLAEVRARMHGGATLPVTAFDRALETRIASGTLTAIDNQVDTTTGTVKLRATFENTDDALFPNQFVNTRLLVKTLQGVTLIPDERHPTQWPGKLRIRHRRRRGAHADRQDRHGECRLHGRRRHPPGSRCGHQQLRKAAGQRPGGSHEKAGSRRQGEGRYSVSPSRPFILRPVATSLLMAAILLAGMVAYTQLPVSALPQVDYPTIQVVTFYPGASPHVMATTVTAPLERQFGQIQGLSQMTSTSSGGCSVIVLQFNLDLNIDVAEQEVQSAINAAQSYLPSNLPVPPVYNKANPADAPVLTLAITSGSMPLPLVQDLVDTRLSPKLSQLSGVGLVSISGGQKPAVRIQANPAALSSYGLNLEDLRTALTQTSVNGAKGNFDGPHQNYQINANDQLLTSADYHSVVVAYRNNAPVFLKDVAQVVDGVENNKLAAWMNQTPAVIVNIQRQPGANTISVVNGIKALLPQLLANLPASVQVTRLTDLTTAIHASVSDVEFELMLTIALVVMVIFLFLRSLSATIIPSVAVPLSLVGTFVAMYVLGYSLDNLSLMALTISTGFVVDDAIVMIENISRYIEEGDPPMEAALKGAEQIGFTILSLTVSLIAVLIPLLFMGGVVGRLFREFAVTLAVTVIISAVVSLTLTPMMSARILKRVDPARQNRFYAASERAFTSLIAFYGRTLRIVLRFQGLILLVALATLVLTIFLYIIIPKGFFPAQDIGVIQGISQAPETISFTAMAERQRELAEVILRDPAVESLSSFIGADGTNTTLNSGRMSINLKPLEVRRMNASDVIRRLQQNLQVGAGDHPLHAARAEHYGRRSREPDAIPVHAGRSRCQRAQFMDRPFRSQARTTAPAGRRGDRPAKPRPRVHRSSSTASPRPVWASLPQPSTTPCTMRSASARSIPCTRS